jgi:hypothetical protein
VAVTAPLIFVATYVLMRLIIGQPDLTVPWAEFISQAEIEGVEGMTTAVGALFGFGVGITLEGSRVRFLAGGPAWKRILRYFLGIAVTVAIWGGLRAVFPSQPLWLAIPLRLLRYILATLWIGYYAPMTFVRLHLADAEPEPGIDLTL